MAITKDFYRRLTRKKFVPSDSEALLEGGGLKRALTLLDLTALGVGSTLGVGVYVLAGSVSKDTAGPAVVISFLIAGIASAFAGLCYAEFAARVPKAGSAYIYSYVCVGEFVAFIIGWNLILEYVVGSASVVRGLSGYVDNLFGGVMAEAFSSWLPMDVSFLSPYPDFFAFFLSLVFAAIVAFGVKESSTFNNVFTTINIAVVLYVIICGLFKVDIKNWSIDMEDIPPEYQEGAGNGGFAPFGITGIISGAATCFYGFVGFDCIATTGEEAKNPQRDIPIAIVISLSIIFLGYFGVSSVLTLMWPYYLQDPEAPLPHVFREIGWDVAAWIVTIGALFGLCASLMGALFPLPRVMYAMSKDGIVFPFLGKIQERFQTPVFGTLLAGLLTGFLAMLFDLDQLVDMMSIGTLLAYSIVAACVLLLRYQPADEEEMKKAKDLAPPEINFKVICEQMINKRRLKTPSELSANITTWGTLTYICIALVVGLVLKLAGADLFKGEPYAIALVVIVGGIAAFNLFVIGMQPGSKKTLFFKIIEIIYSMPNVRRNEDAVIWSINVGLAFNFLHNASRIASSTASYFLLTFVPLVPLVPGLSIWVNLYLMVMLDGATWIRFAGWMAIGFAIYFGYGIWHSKTPIPTSRKHSLKGIVNDGFEDSSTTKHRDS